MMMKALVCVVALVAVVHAAIMRDDAVEYARSDSQVALWTKRSPLTGSPVLLHFPADVTVGDALPRITAAFLGSAAAATGECSIVSSDMPHVLASRSLAADMKLHFAVESSTFLAADAVLARGAISLFCSTERAAAQQQLQRAGAVRTGAATAPTSSHGKGWFRFPFVAYTPQAPPPASRPKWVGSSQYPNINADLIGDTLTGLLHWGVEFLAVHWGDLQPFQSWASSGQSGRFNLNTGAPISVDTPGALAFADGSSRRTSDDETRVALTADWGSGTQESAYVANLLVKDYAPQWTLHLGDVYYLGASEDFASNVFGKAPAGVANGVTWPHGSIGSLGTCGNHEMYSRGVAFFTEFLPTLGVRNSSGVLGGQAASYWSLENDYWRVIALDTGYNTYSVLFENNDNPQPQPVIDWLQNDVKIGDPSDTRGIVFLSHHQTFTAFEKDDPYLATPKQINALLPANRTVLWLWGHEHRVSFYDVANGFDGLENLHVYGRCIGNGGFPTSHAPIPNRAGVTGLTVYDDRVYQTYDGFWTADIGFQGFQHLNFTGAQLTIDYKSLSLEADGKTPSPTASDLLVSETWGIAADGSVQLNAFNVVNPNMTIVNP